VALNHHRAIHSPGIHIRPHQPNHTRIVDARFESAVQDVVVDPVNAFGQVHHHALT